VGGRGPHRGRGHPAEAGRAADRRVAHGGGGPGAARRGGGRGGQGRGPHGRLRRLQRAAPRLRPVLPGRRRGRRRLPRLARLRRGEHRGHRDHRHPRTGRGAAHRGRLHRPDVPRGALPGAVRGGGPAQGPAEHAGVHRRRQPQLDHRAGEADRPAVALRARPRGRFRAERLQLPGHRGRHRLRAEAVGIAGRRPLRHRHQPQRQRAAGGGHRRGVVQPARPGAGRAAHHGDRRPAGRRLSVDQAARGVRRRVPRRSPGR
jgi:hypothetical protein